MAKQYIKVYANRVSLDDCLGDWEPRQDPTPSFEDAFTREEILSRFVGIKHTVVEHLMEGYNFHQIYKKLSKESPELNIKESQIYKIKSELMSDFAYLLDQNQRNEAIKKHGPALSAFVSQVASLSEHMELSAFSQNFVYDYDSEADLKGWKPISFQDTLESIWEDNIKSCVLAPREHLKTSTALNWIIKKVFTRKYPIEINYYHLSDELAAEKFRKLQRIVESNLILSSSFDIARAKSWSEQKIELSDGTIIQPLSYQQGVVGKHPHIIILDDVIDRRVIYSDQLNQKAIDKFYSDIYPMISKFDQDKRIIVIGTAQRKDDLYHKLPKDFHFEVFKAVIDEESQQVLCPELFSYSDLMKIKTDISSKHGEKYWLKEYMNTPFEAMGLIIKPDWIKRYSKLPEKRVNSNGEEEIINYETYTGWDLSVGKDIEKGDWTVGMTIKIDRGGDKVKIYLHSYRRGRWDFGTRLKMVVDDFGDNTPQIIGIEEVAFQYDTVKTLQDQTMLPVRGVKAIHNKTESFQVELSPYFENLQVYIPEGDEWDIVVQELLALPVGEFDDIGDALKIAIKTALLQKEPEIRFI